MNMDKFKKNNKDEDLKFQPQEHRENCFVSEVENSNESDSSTHGQRKRRTTLIHSLVSNENSVQHITVRGNHIVSQNMTNLMIPNNVKGNRECS